MASISADLLTQCRMALHLTQQELADDVLGCTKRSIQRWERAGAMLFDSQFEALARALHPVSPDLAQEVAKAGGTTLQRLGLAPQPEGEPVSMEDRVASVVRAAADAMGVAPNAIRGAVAAAFSQADKEALDVRAVVEGLLGNERPSP